MIKKISVIFPTFNESENLPILYKKLNKELGTRDIDFEVIIIDDNSPDGTWEVAKKLEKESQKVKAIIRKNEKGLATAIKTGIENSQYPLICIMDTDLSHPPKDIVRMLNFFPEYDMVWASRYVKGGKMNAMGKKRLQRWLSLIFNYYLKIILGINILDCTNGFFISKREAFDLVNKNRTFNGYGDFSFKLLYYLKRENLRMIEIPFTYEERKYGYSKTGLITVALKYFYESLKLIARNFFQR